MKSSRILFALVVLAATLAFVASAGAAQRLVIVEGFTQWNCGPCATWNPQERAILEAFTQDTVIAIKYHGWWPGANNDAFFLWNVPENTNRINYYGVTWVPWGQCDGIIDMSNVGQALLRNSVRTRYAIPSPCTIDLFATVSGETTVNFTGTVNAESDMLGSNLKLFVTLISNRVTYSSPPGANGETIFDNVFRDVWPGSTGQAFTVNAGGTYEFSGSLNKAAAWDPDGLSVIAFVQDYGTTEIMQSKISPVNQNYGMFTESASARQLIWPVNGGEVVYQVDLTNVGALDDTYDVNLEGAFPAGWTHTVEASGVPADPAHIQVPVTSQQTVALIVRVNPTGHAGSVDFDVHVTTPSEPLLSCTENFRLMSGLDILLVDDDGGADHESWFEDAIAPLGMVSGRWDMSLNTLDLSYLTDVNVIVWFTGDAFQPGTTITDEDQAMLSSYLDQGGRIFITGQGIGFDIRTDPFFANYIHGLFRMQWSNHFNLPGIPGDPISDGLDLVINGGDGSGNQTRQHSVSPDSSGFAAAAWNWDTSPPYGGYPAIRVQTPNYRLVYMGFSFEAIDNAADRHAVMQRTVNWLLLGTDADDPAPAVPAEFAVGQNYPNPFNPETTIPYVLPERALVTVHVFDVLGRDVTTLTEGLQEAGAHAIRFNGADLSSGLYFYRVDAAMGDNTLTATRKLMLLK